jgi:hypothetical protein
MTGYRSRFFRHNCRTNGCYSEQLPDWGDLIECFPRGIRPTDVDGMVEINGRFLFLEEKRAGVRLPEAQRLALLKLSQRPGITTVFFRPSGLRIASDLECLVFGQGPAQGWQPRSREWLKDFLKDWSDAADAAPSAGDTAA